MPHSHDHEGPCSHEADGIDPLEMGLQYSLYQKIDLDNLEVLNEAEEQSGKNVFKPYEERLNFEKFVESDCDPELLFNIPFTGNIKLKGIRIIGPNDNSHPRKGILVISTFSGFKNFLLSSPAFQEPSEDDIRRHLSQSRSRVRVGKGFFRNNRVQHAGGQVQLGLSFVAAFPGELRRGHESNLLHRTEGRVLAKDCARRHYLHVRVSTQRCRSQELSPGSGPTSAAVILNYFL